MTKLSDNQLKKKEIMDKIETNNLLVNKIILDKLQSNSSKINKDKLKSIEKLIDILIKEKDLIKERSAKQQFLDNLILKKKIRDERTT
jgi:hypothetical protein